MSPLADLSKRWYIVLRCTICGPLGLLFRLPWVIGFKKLFWDNSNFRILSTLLVWHRQFKLILYLSVLLDVAGTSRVIPFYSLKTFALCLTPCWKMESEIKHRMYQNTPTSTNQVSLFYRNICLVIFDLSVHRYSLMIWPVIMENFRIWTREHKVTQISTDL